jgi:parvulin-like peptidyl-prolyl isomerase
MGLREIVCANSLIADSVYALLLGGEDFGKLVSKFSISKSRALNGDLGEVDIHRYTEEVQKALLHLRENEFTKPLAMGEQYAIFQRIVWDVRLQ